MMKKYRLSALLLTLGLLAAALFTPAAVQAVEAACYSYEEAAEEIRTALAERQATFDVTIDFDFFYDGGVSGKKLISNAISYPGVGSGKGRLGDYLYYSYKKWGAQIDQDSNYDFVFTFNVTYYTNSSQESWLETNVDSALASLGLAGKNEFQKISAIYDYIASKVVYDDAEGKSSTILHPLAYTAYGALHDGTAVCQGYATLFYMMCNEAGIGCRIVSGQANGSNGTEDHAWNVVRLGGKWYNVDVTWDTVYKRAGRSYKYFLKNNADFSDHYRDSEYTSASFNAECPMSSSSYGTGSGSASGSGSGSGTSYKLTVNGGSGSGSYAAGTVVTITANSASGGRRFSKWSGNATFVNGTSATSSTAKVKVTTTTTLTATYADSAVTNIQLKKYKLNSKSQSAKFLTIKGNSKKNNAPVVLGKKTAKTATFKVTSAGNGYYYLVNVATKKYLILKGSKVVQGKKNNSSCKWQFISTGGSYYKLKNQNGKIVTISAKSVTVAPDKNSNAQQIKLA